MGSRKASIPSATPFHHSSESLTELIYKPSSSLLSKSCQTDSVSLVFACACSSLMVRACVYLWYSYSMEVGQILMINMCPSMPPKIIWLQMERAIIIRRSCHSLPSIKRIFSQAHTQKTHSIRKSSHYAKTNIMEIVCKQSLQGRQTQTSNMRILSMLPHSLSSPRKWSILYISHGAIFSK